MTHVFGWAWDGAHWIAWHSSFSLQQRPLHDCVLQFHVVRARLEISQLRQSVQLLGGQVASDAAPLGDRVTHVVTDKDPTREELNGPQTPPLSRGQLLLNKSASRQGSKTAASAHSHILERAKELRVKLWNVSLFVRWVEYQLSGLSSGLTAFAAVAGLQQQVQQLQQHQHQQQTHSNHISHSHQLTNGFNSASLSSSASNKAKTVAQPNIKVEDHRQRYKPQQKTLKEPYLHLDPEYPASPFDDPGHQQKFVKRERARRFEEINNNLVDKVQGKEVSKRKDDTGGGGGGGTGAVKKSINPPKQQYCECCNAYFYHLDEHLQSEQHRKFFGASDEQFRCVRDLIDKLQPQWMGSLQPSLTLQQQQHQNRETLQYLQVAEHHLSASLVHSLGQLEQQLAIASQGKSTEALLPLVGLESSLALPALPEARQQQRHQQPSQKPSTTPLGGRNSNNYSVVGSTSAAVSNNNNSRSAAAGSGTNGLTSLSAVNSSVVGSGNGDMHPASAYALNMRQHMLNQAYRNAASSGQPAGGAVGGVGAHAALLGRQAPASAGHFDSGHGGHHVSNSGVALKGGVPESIEGLEGGASAGVGHRGVGGAGPGASQSANPFQGLDLLNSTEQLIAAATAATSGVPLDFSRTAPPHHSLAAAMMRDLSAHLPTTPISHHAMLAAHHPHAAAYNLSQAAQAAHNEKILDDWLPKLQDQLGVGHSGHHGGHHTATGGQASSTQALDMWNALGQDQNTAAQPNVLDLFAALGGTGDQDFAQLNLQSFLQVMTNVEEDRKRAQQIYNQATTAPTGGHHHSTGAHYQQQQQQQTTQKNKERHSHSQQIHHQGQGQLSNQGNNSVAPAPSRSELPDLPDRVVNADPSPKDKDYDTAGSQSATPSPQESHQQTTPQQQRTNRAASSVQPHQTQDYDSPLQKSQYSSPMPKDELPEANLVSKKTPGQDDASQHDSKGFSDKQLEMINQGLSELHKLIDQPGSVDNLSAVSTANNTRVVDASPQGPPSNNQQQQAQDFPQTFTPEISGPQQAQNAFPDVVSPFDGQQGGQLSQQQQGPTQQTHTPQQGHHTPQQGHHTPQQGHHTPQQGHHTPQQQGHHTPQQQGHHTPQQQGHHTPQQQGHHTPQQQGHHTPQQSHTPQQGHTPQQQGHTTPYYEGGPRSVPPPGQMQNNPPSVPTTNPPSVPMSENGLTPQHTPQRHGPLTPQPMLHQPPTPHTPHTPMTPHTPLTPHNNNNQGEHMQSPAGLHGRAPQQQQQPNAAATSSMGQMLQQQQPANVAPMDQQSASQGQPNAMDKYDFQDDPLAGAPVDSQMASPWHQHQQQQQVLPSLQHMAADKGDWQSTGLPQFEAISSDNAKDGHAQGMVMTAMDQGMGQTGPHQQQQQMGTHHHMSGHMANDNAAPVPAPYEKELPSKYLKGRGYQGYGQQQQQQHGMSGGMGMGGGLMSGGGLMPGGVLSQESNDVLSSQDSNSLASSNANTPQHSGVHGNTTTGQQQTSITSFGYHNETSKDSTDFAALDKKSYVHAIAQHHQQQQHHHQQHHQHHQHQLQQQQQQVQHQQSGDSGSHNRWTAQRKAKRGRYGGIKLQFTPAGRNKTQGAGGVGPAGYGSQHGGHHSMFSPSQNNSHAAPKGDPYDWNDEDEASLTPTIRKRNSRNSHASSAPLSFSQFTQQQQQPQQPAHPFHYQQFHEQQQHAATSSYQQPSYGHNQQHGYQQQHYQQGTGGGSGGGGVGYQEQQQQQQSSYHHQPPTQPPQSSSSSSAAGGSASQVSGSNSTDPHDEWKMKMVSETKIVLKKFSLSSGGKPMSYSKHPRKRHI